VSTILHHFHFTVHFFSIHPEGKKNIIAGLIQEYDIKTAADIQEALKDLLGGTIQEMMEAELD
jgi:hypothetical protein